MADHPMVYAEEIPTRGSNSGWKLFRVEQATASAVADNDTISFPNTAIANIQILSLRSATGQVVNCDALADASGSARFTVDHPDAATSKHTFGTLATGAAATSIAGLVMVRGKL
jgi:hypothetical protein